MNACFGHGVQLNRSFPHCRAVRRARPSATVLDDVARGAELLALHAWNDADISHIPSMAATHGPATASRRSDNDQGSFRRLRKSRTNRAQQHAGEPTAAVAADHDELSVFGFLKEPVGRFVADEPSLHAHVGIPLLPTRQAFG